MITFALKRNKKMATQKQIEELKIDENVFELTEDTELEYLVHFMAPFTGSDKCVVPKGTAFAPHSPMRGDALYMHFVDGDKVALFKKMEALVKANYADLFPVCKASPSSSPKSSSRRCLSNSVKAVQSAYWKSSIACAHHYIRCLNDRGHLNDFLCALHFSDFFPPPPYCFFLYSRHTHE